MPANRSPVNVAVPVKDRLPVRVSGPLILVLPLRVVCSLTVKILEIKSSEEP